MNISDPIADMLTRVRNASRARHTEVVVPASRTKREPKFKVRGYSRCFVCGRSRAYMRRFALCRICFRERALLGELPGVTKSSW